MPAGISAHKKDRSEDRSFLRSHTAAFARIPSYYTVGAGFHARPALVKGRRGCARMKWCAGGAREIAYVGMWTLLGAPRVTRVQSVTPNGCG